MNEAKHAATLIRRRIDEVSTQVRRNPALVRMVMANNGDQVAQWYSDNGASREFNVSDAQRRLSGLVAVHGQEVLRTRSGQITPVNFNVGL